MTGDTRTTRPLRQALCALASAGVAACATGPATPAPRQPPPQTIVDTIVLLDTVRVETESPVNVDLEARVARLQIQLLERDVRLAELQTQLEGTRLELVRNMARLQTQASRAEAASGMAEAEIALASLQRDNGGTVLAEVARAEDLLAQSSEEFASENYGGALYLATQVRSIVRSAQGRLRAGVGESLREGESLFAVPVPLQTSARSNVRSGPGLDFDVLFTLDAATPLVGQSYTSEWVRVVDGESREGWIFHTLVEGR